MKRLAWILGPVLALGLALAVAAGFALRTLEPAASGSDRRVIFRVAPGESLAAVARRLEDESLVRSATGFKLLARWREEDGSLQVGEFELSPSMTPREILRRIVEGQVVTYEVAIPEGLGMVQIAERLAEAGLVERDAFLAVARDPETAAALGVQGATLEGYLFPETYRMPRGLPPREVARLLVDQFLEVWHELAPRAARQDLSMKEVVTLGSIVEKETGAPEERPLIAAVFLNRLRRGMRLETDPTVIYGIPDFDGNLRRGDLENGANPYNTYKIRGLPPGPIASPGRESLAAVLNPAPSDYLFFVSRNDGTHVFSRTYAEHTKAVDRYQKRNRN